MYDLAENEGRYDGSCWFSVKPELKEKNPLINLPYVIDGENVISQTNACFSYLGRKLNLWGNTDQEIIAVEQLLCELMDLRNSMTKFAYSSVDSSTELLDEVTSKNGFFQKFELWLGRGVNAGQSGTFLVGDHATAPDFHLYEMLYQYTSLASYKGRNNLLEAFPRLANFFASFAALPANRKYLESNIGSPSPNLLPFNQKMAQFGATPSGDSWTVGMNYDFNSFTGIY